MRVKNVDIETGALVVLINAADAMSQGIHAGDRVIVRSSNKTGIAIVNISEAMKKGTIGFTKDMRSELIVKDGTDVTLITMPMPKSLISIRNRLNNVRLDAQSAYEIVKDTVTKRLDKEEITAFVISLHEYPIDLEEAAYISEAMVKTGETLKLNRKRIFDKHSIGGVPGDKTSMLVVPIVAAAGLTIPKTSSRAITSAAGTADRAEVLMPVALDVNEVKRVVEKTNGCLVWGGAVHLAPADDIFVKIEYPFSIDPLMLPSIISKKKAVGATDMVLDVPVGATMKIKNNQEGMTLIKEFNVIGKKLGIKIEGALTNGTQPIGYNVGAAAEAKEVLEAITGRTKAIDLIDKATSIAGILLGMAGKKNGKQLAKSIIEKGLAEKKLRQIIEEQGGDPKVKAGDIRLGEHEESIYAERDGTVLGFDNIAIANAVKLAGAPSNKQAALVLAKKLFDKVKKGDLLFTLYSESAPLLSSAIKYVHENQPVIIGNTNKMLIRHIKIKNIQEQFILER
ncbi:MAG: AMP phosphorylase [Candidatus Micrarchaeaceae archaeon]